MSETTEPIDVQVARAIGLAVEKNPFNVWMERTSPDHRSRSLGEYSTDRNAAMDALERFCEKNGCEWELTYMRVDKSVKPFTVACQIWPANGTERQTLALEHGQSIPAAICAAILEAAAAKEPAK